MFNGMNSFIPLNEIDIDNWYLVDLHGKYVVNGPYLTQKLAEKYCIKNRIDVLSSKNPYDIWQGSKILIAFSE